MYVFVFVNQMAMDEAVGGGDGGGGTLWPKEHWQINSKQQWIDWTG
jgi:hypothetical protein